MDSPNSCGGKMPTAAELRKSNKPLMEKKRRARINHCLAQLKSLVVDAMRKENTKCTKLEKADILELTVKHLRNIQRQRLTGASARRDSDVLSKYVAGFNECATEVSRFLALEGGHELEVRTNLLNHLAGCLQRVGTPSPPPVSVKQELPSPPASQVFSPPTPPVGQSMYSHSQTLHGAMATSPISGLPHHLTQMTPSPAMLIPPHASIHMGTNGAFRVAHPATTESSSLYKTPIQAHSSRLGSASVSATVTSPSGSSPVHTWHIPLPRATSKQVVIDVPAHAAEAPVLPPREQSPNQNGQQQIQPRKLDMDSEHMWRPW